MSLGSALWIASSGLQATSRAADVVSGNVANALTPGYKRREIVLGAQNLGGEGVGVRVLGTTRAFDPLLLNDRMLAQAAVGVADTQARALERIETAIGDPTQAGSLSGRIASFEGRLVEAASRPDAAGRLSNALTSARQLVDAVNAAGNEIQAQRSVADSGIAEMVDRLNDGLARVAALNSEITRLGALQRESSGLLEERQKIVDDIAELVPMRQVARQSGQVALYSDGGLVLLDGRPRPLEFTAIGRVAPGMTSDPGVLSGLSREGEPIGVTGPGSMIAGGALQAQFALRDDLLPQAQAGLDALARDLVDRFADPTLDPSLAAGDAGLFTDAGLPFDPADEVGLAQRLSLNPDVDPQAGGALWRLRDGVGAATPGDVGQSGLLAALAERLQAPVAPASGPLAGQTRSFSDHAATLLSDIATRRQDLDGEATFQSVRLEALRTREGAEGVDTDDEMQKLLAIEQAYGANARVIQTLEDLMDRLLGI